MRLAKANTKGKLSSNKVLSSKLSHFPVIPAVYPDTNPFRIELAE